LEAEMEKIIGSRRENEEIYFDYNRGDFA
jgi:hypothetical protein